MGHTSRKARVSLERPIFVARTSVCRSLRLSIKSFYFFFKLFEVHPWCGWVNPSFCQLLLVLQRMISVKKPFRLFMFRYEIFPWHSFFRKKEFHKNVQSVSHSSRRQWTLEWTNDHRDFPTQSYGYFETCVKYL